MKVILKPTCKSAWTTLVIFRKIELIYCIRGLLGSRMYRVRAGVVLKWGLAILSDSFHPNTFFDASQSREPTPELL